MKINPTVLKWRHDDQNEDGSNFDASRFAGWEAEINGETLLGVPAGWHDAGEYSVPIAQLGLPAGEYTLRLRLVATVTDTGTGETTVMPSAWSNATHFQLVPVPRAPFDVTVE